MPVASRIEELRNEMSALAERSANADDLMRKMVKLLRERMLKYNWAGFYMLEPGTQPPVLALGAVDGAPTPHTRIPLNQGQVRAPEIGRVWLNSPPHSFRPSRGRA